MDMTKFCHSCGCPTEMPEFKGPVENFCKHCVDESGKLHPREAVQQGVAQWFKMWMPDLDDAKALARADHYLKAMPAWAAD